MKKINHAAVAEFFKERSEIINKIGYIDTISMESFYSFSLNETHSETITPELLEALKDHLRNDLKKRLDMIHYNLANLGIEIKE